MPVFVPGDLDLQTCPREGPNMSLCEFDANLFRVPEIFHTQTKKAQTDKAKKQNPMQFTACGKHLSTSATGVCGVRPSCQPLQNDLQGE